MDLSREEMERKTSRIGAIFRGWLGSGVLVRKMSEKKTLQIGVNLSACQGSQHGRE